MSSCRALPHASVFPKVSFQGNSVRVHKVKTILGMWGQGCQTHISPLHYCLLSIQELLRLLQKGCPSWETPSKNYTYKRLVQQYKCYNGVRSTQNVNWIQRLKGCFPMAVKMFIQTSLELKAESHCL